MKTLFQIESTEARDAADRLLLEVGPDHCSYALFDAASRSIPLLRYFASDEFTMVTEFPAMLEELKGIRYKDVLLCSCYPTAMLVPFAYETENGRLLEMVYEPSGLHHFRDTISEWQFYNSYGLPSFIVEAVDRVYPSVSCCHVYTPALRIYNGFAAEDQIAVHFTTQHFSVLVKRASQVVLVQMYTYKTPLDVIYYLLKICSELNLQQSEVYIVLSGLVEGASALYKEIRNYFLNIHFSQPPAITLPAHDYPYHFFQTTYNLAACVS